MSDFGRNMLIIDRPWWAIFVIRRTKITIQAEEICRYSGRRSFKDCYAVRVSRTRHRSPSPNPILTRHVAVSSLLVIPDGVLCAARWCERAVATNAYDCSRSVQADLGFAGAELSMPRVVSRCEVRPLGPLVRAMRSGAGRLVRAQHVSRGL